LYFLQNVFQQEVQRESNYLLSTRVLEKFQKEGIETTSLNQLSDSTFSSSAELVSAVSSIVPLSSQQGLKVVEFSLQKSLVITQEKIASMDKKGLSSIQLDALNQLQGQTFNFPWQLGDSLAEISSEWKVRGGGLKNKLNDRKIKQKLAYLYRNF
jgi:hypothetical protein